MRFDPSKLANRSILVRLSILFCVTFAVGLTLAFLIAYFEIRFTLERSGRDVISAKLREIATVYKMDGPESLKSFLAIETNRANNLKFMVRIVDEKNNVIFNKSSEQEKRFDFDELAKSRLRRVGWFSLQAIDDEDKFNILTEELDKTHFLQVGRSNEDREGILGGIAYIFTYIGLAMVVLTGASGTWYVHRALRPVRELAEVMKRVEGGDLSQRATTSRTDDELATLARTFNLMIVRIDRLVKTMTESLDNVAHDIRTPLTRIRFVAETALVSGKPAELSDALSECAESATDISELMQQLLSISEAEAGTLSLEKKSTSVPELIIDVCEIYEFVAQEKNIKLSVAIDPSINEWVLDRKRVKQAIGNLIDNAIKFSPENSEIWVSARRSRDDLSIEVRDQGFGIPSDEIERIWDRLYRAEQSRTSKGLGLGLSIVKAIAIAHGGDVRTVSAAGNGSTFEIHLPEIISA